MEQHLSELRIAVYRYDDGMRHLELDIPQHGTGMTLCGISDCRTNQRRGKPLKGEHDCPDCEYVLHLTQRYLRSLAAPAGDLPQ